VEADVANVSLLACYLYRLTQRPQQEYKREAQ